MTKSRKIGPMRVYPDMVKGNATGKWIVSIPAKYSDTGKRRRFFFPSKTQAEKAARETNLRIKSQGPEGRLIQRSSNMLVKQGIKEWVANQELLVLAGHLRASSLRSRQYQLVQIEKRLGNCLIDSLTKERILEYQAKRIRDGLNPVTINCEVAALKQVLLWLQEEGRISSVPKVKRVPEKKRNLNIPTQQEVLKVIHYLPYR